VDKRPHAAALDDTLVARITQLCELGDDDVESGRFDEAIARYREAFTLVPRPVHAWAVSTFILPSIAVAHYLAGDYARTRDAVNEAFGCDGAVGNPFLHLRMGQAEHLLGNRGRAVDELIRAYERGGEEVFAGEDPKYLALVKASLD
jgi:tetratricopeptide (TPR) repeat protein